jgi:hypothetical protein
VRNARDQLSYSLSELAADHDAKARIDNGALALKLEFYGKAFANADGPGRPTLTV